MEKETENKSLAPKEDKQAHQPDRFGPEGEMSFKNPHFGEDMPREEWDSAFKVAPKDVSDDDS